MGFFLNVATPILRSYNPFVHCSRSKGTIWYSSVIICLAKMEDFQELEPFFVWLVYFPWVGGLAWWPISWRLLWIVVSLVDDCEPSIFLSTTRVDQLLAFGFLRDSYLWLLLVFSRLGYRESHAWQKQVLKTRRMHLLLSLSVRNSSSKSAKSQISKVIGMQCSWTSNGP